MSIYVYQLCYSFTSLIYHFDNSSKMNNSLMRHYSFCLYLSLLNINIIHHFGFTFHTALIFSFSLFLFLCFSFNCLCFLFAAFSACHRISTDVNKHKIYIYFAGKVIVVVFKFVLKNVFSFSALHSRELRVSAFFSFIKRGKI